MKNLIIVESPSKSKTIEKYLGKDYKVVSSKGHICDLALKGKEGLGVDVENNFKTTYEISSDKKNVVKELKEYTKKAENVYLATDPDREGEAISWHLARELNLNLEDNNRIEFHEITKNAIIKALDNPRTIDMALVRSQETRRILDRILGFKLSKILQKKIKSKSAGRVQSVALRLICDREHEIEAFVSKEYWSIKALLSKDKKEIEAELTKIDSNKVDINTKEEADGIISRIKEPIELVNVVEKNKNRAPYLPFITSTLQQEASSKLSLSSKKTMSIAQSLYESGYITYMRTDSTRLSNEFVNNAFKYIEDNYGDEYKGIYRVKNDANSQDAHEAIRPTSLDNDPESLKGTLNNDQYKLYRFIYCRALASLMKDAVFASKTYVFNTNDLEFQASGSVKVFDGFLKVYDKYDSSKDTVLPNLNKGDLMSLLKVIPEQHFTEPPFRYTEAKLIKALDEDGVGRPSTYATIIETIQKREYVELKKASDTSKVKVFYPTSQGMLTDDKLKEFFIDMINIEYTAKMEKELDDIAEDKMNYLDALNDFYNKLVGLVENADLNMKKIEAEKTGEKCPECGGDLVIRKGKNGDFVACSNFPKCKYIKKEEVKPEDLEKTGEKCPECGGDLVYKMGRYGKFIGCINYPSCKYLTNLKGLTKKPAEKIGRICPQCGGDLVKRSSKRGDFIACGNFPKCRYTEKI